MPAHVSVKEAVLPFDRFPDVDTLLGPEMKSTGEVMGIDSQFGPAYAKAQQGARQNLPADGTVFISVASADKPKVLPVAAQFHRLGFTIVSRAVRTLFERQRHSAKMINKVSMGRPHVVDDIKNGNIQFVINTGMGDTSRRDGYLIRRAAIKFNIPYTTTIAGAMAMGKGIEALIEKKLSVLTIQEYNASHD